ncbi:purine-cytosine permease family protein [Aneurinibacillus terranovensis]|uniref:purine-cytosine permease family protein n=1 Tax=Aneurinibacillus terranovensis TaxID=278991 RepID=UPI0003F9CDF7|nr:cytosine permease [Aneurinibacillus terranovensis]
MSDKNIYTKDSLEYIPKEKQNFSFLNMLAIFMGMQVPISYFLVGGSISAGLTLSQALTVTILAFIVGFIIFSLVGVIGQQAGVTTMVASRPAFGIMGAILPALITFISLAGWDSVHIQLAGVMLNDTSKEFLGWGNQHVYSLIVGIIIVVLVVFGPNVLKVMEQYLVPAVLLLVIMALYIAFGDHSLSELLHKAGKGPITPAIGFDAMLISSLTWVPMVADYSRFGKTRKTTFWAALIGSVPVGFLMNAIGQISAVSLGNPNPLMAMLHHGSVFSVVSFIVIIFATVATAALILYSSAISAVSVFPNASVKKMSAIIGVICIGLAIGVNLLGDVIGWLNFQGYLLIPLFSVILIDYFLVHKSYYEPRELFNKKGKFMFYKGFNLVGYVSWVAGAITFFSAKNSAIGGAFLSMLVSGLCYVLLQKINVAKTTSFPVSEEKVES